MVRGRLSVSFAAVIVVGACTTILGDDFEISDTTSATIGSTVASSAGGATSSSGGGMSAGGAGGGASGENCLNGTDDDSDGLVDCEDSDCMAFACIPPIPSSWTGPIALSQVAHGAPKPSCPNAFPDETYNGVTGLNAADVVCNSCTCAPNNPTCTPSAVAHYQQSSCGGWPFAGPNPPGGCQQQSALPGTISVRIGNPTANLNCMASGGGVSSTPAPTWATASRACAYGGTLGGGCAMDEMCAPASPSGSFSDTVCILKAGDEVCPAPFTVKRLYSDDETDVNDTRGCSQCSCTQQSASCSVSTQFFSSSNCTGSPVFTIANNNVCNNSNINGLYTKANITGAPTGNCNVSQNATPQGGVTASGPFTTLCCL